MVIQKRGTSDAKMDVMAHPAAELEAPRRSTLTHALLAREAPHRSTLTHRPEAPHRSTLTHALLAREAPHRSTLTHHLAEVGAVELRASANAMDYRYFNYL